jgi:hypothetical protein
MKIWGSREVCPTVAILLVRSIPVVATEILNFSSGALTMGFGGCSRLWKLPAFLTQRNNCQRNQESDALPTKPPSARLQIDDISTYASLQDISIQHAP